MRGEGPGNEASLRLLRHIARRKKATSTRSAYRSNKKTVRR